MQPLRGTDFRNPLPGMMLDAVTTNLIAATGNIRHGAVKIDICPCVR